MTGDVEGETSPEDARALDSLKRGTRTFATLESSDQKQLLNRVAALAANGSTEWLDVLLRLVDEHRLDRVAIRKVVIDDADVEDAHQDVLISIARSIGNFRSDAAFTTWLHTVARNTAVDLLRKRKPTDRLHTGLEMTSAQHVSSLISSRQTLRGVLDEMPEHYRQAVVLRDIERCSYTEIADKLGIELNTVKSRIARGRALIASSDHFRKEESKPSP